MIRVALDTDNLDLLGPLAPVMMTYSDLVPNPAQLRQKIAPSTLVLIDRALGDPSGEASVCDIESGAFTPSQFPDWFDDKTVAGVPYLTAYADRNNMPAVDSAAGARDFFRWFATLDGTAHIDGFRPLRTPALIQVLGETALGVHFDLSLIYESQWHPAIARLRPQVTLGVQRAISDHAARLSDEVDAVITHWLQL